MARAAARSLSARGRDGPGPERQFGVPPAHCRLSRARPPRPPQDCTITVACRQLRVSGCTRVSFNLHCQQQPSVEASTALKFSAFGGRYAGMFSHFRVREPYRPSNHMYTPVMRQLASPGATRLPRTIAQQPPYCVFTALPQEAKLDWHTNMWSKVFDFDGGLGGTPNWELAFDVPPW